MATTKFDQPAPQDTAKSAELRAAWAGLPCRTFPAAAPSSGPALPDSTTTAYSALLAPRTVVETSR